MAGLLQPRTGKRRDTKGDYHYLEVLLLKLSLPLAQLCHVFAAGQSTQVAQENQYDILPTF